jgi:hypothetical protein
VTGRERAEKAFEIGREDRDHRQFLAADRDGPQQDGQAAKTKLLAGSCLRILDQGLGPTRARHSKDWPLEGPNTMAG